MGLHRPKLRVDTIEQIKANSPKNEEGKFIDPNTGNVIPEKEGKQVYDIGHKPGYEHRREVEKAEEEGLTQAEFNDRMNDPNKYHIEDRSENRSRKHEMKDQQTATETEQTEEQGQAM